MGELLGLGKRPAVPEEIARVRQDRYGSIRPMTTMEQWEMRAQEAYASQSPMKRMDVVPDIGPAAGVVKPLVTPGVVGDVSQVVRGGRRVGDLAGPSVDGVFLPHSRPTAVSPTSVDPGELKQLIPEWAFKEYEKYWNVPKKKGSK